MADPVKTNYYDVLGVGHAATAEDIQAAFLKLAAEYQAKGKPANVEAVERFREIVRAHRVLSDQEQRDRYDRLGEAGVDPGQTASGYDPEQLERLVQSRLWPSQWLTIETVPAIIKDLRTLSDIDKD